MYSTKESKVQITDNTYSICCRASHQ